MITSYLWRELLRNGRRTLASVIGVVLGTGLFAGILFFIDGSGSTLTARALAPLPLDLQVVSTAPLGSAVALRTSAEPGPWAAGSRHRVSLTLRAAGPGSATEVVLREQLGPKVSYVPGSSTLDGRPLPDPAVGTPLAVGPGSLGLNLGHVDENQTVTAAFTIVARAELPGSSAVGTASVSTGENLDPVPADGPALVGGEALARRIAAVPGVAAADSLGFVDLPPGTLTSGATDAPGPVRLLALTEDYRAHHSDIVLRAGRIAPGSAVISLETASALHLGSGDRLVVALPGGRRVDLPVGGVADLSKARELFTSREGNRLEAYQYHPLSVIVDPSVFTSTVLPALRARDAGRSVVASPAVSEIDVQLRRDTLATDPGAALGQSQRVAAAVGALAPYESFLIDNTSNTLDVARDDADVGTRVFVLLGLPGLVVAGVFAAYAGGVLAEVQRRELATLRVRGAARRSVRRLVLLRAVVLALVGSAAGALIGAAAAAGVLGTGRLLAASALSLVATTLMSVATGSIVAGVGLYLPARRSLRAEIAGEGAELRDEQRSRPRRVLVPLVAVLVLAGTVVAVMVERRSAVPAASVYLGRGVALPLWWFVTPVFGWLAGAVLLGVMTGVTARRVPIDSRFQRSVAGLIGRGLRRRSVPLVALVLPLILVVAIGEGMATFAATYASAASADARHALGGDIRVNPAPVGTLGATSLSPGLLAVPGVGQLSEVVYGDGNAVMTTSFNQDQVSLAAVDPRTYPKVSSLRDDAFSGASVNSAVGELSGPASVYLRTTLSDDLHADVGSDVTILLAAGTNAAAQVKLHVAGLFTDLPGLGRYVNVLIGLDTYRAATHSTAPDFYLLQAGGTSGDRQAVAARITAAAHLPLGSVQTRDTSLATDQSSLTALNIGGLLTLDLGFTAALLVTGLATYGFAVLLQRRREYAALVAHGLAPARLRLLLLAEVGVAAAISLSAGSLLALPTGALLGGALKPLFVVPPVLSVSPVGLAAYAAVAVLATGAVSLGIGVLLQKAETAEVLREI